MMATTVLFSARMREETATTPRHCTGLLQRRGDIMEDGAKESMPSSMTVGK
jgi:hypothetical protein